jgi:hypothetical protein
MDGGRYHVKLTRAAWGESTLELEVATSAVAMSRNGTDQSTSVRPDRTSAAAGRQVRREPMKTGIGGPLDRARSPRPARSLTRRCAEGDGRFSHLPRQTTAQECACRLVIASRVVARRPRTHPILHQAFAPAAFVSAALPCHSDRQIWRGYACSYRGRGRSGCSFDAPRRASRPKA